MEYEAALLRHLSPAQRREDAHALIDYLCLTARKQEVFFLWRPLLRDPNDDTVVEVAVASGSVAIVTHNLADFSGVERVGIRALAPAEFLPQVRGR